MEFLKELEGALLAGWPDADQRLHDGERLVTGLFPSPLGPLTVGYGIDPEGVVYAWAELELPPGWQGEIASGDSWGTLTALRFYRPESQ
jgi:hypothetical protein